MQNLKGKKKSQLEFLNLFPEFKKKKIPFDTWLHSSYISEYNLRSYYPECTQSPLISEGRTWLILWPKKMVIFKLTSSTGLPTTCWYLKRIFRKKKTRKFQIQSLSGNPGRKKKSYNVHISIRPWIWKNSMKITKFKFSAIITGKS